LVAEKEKVYKLEPLLHLQQEAMVDLEEMVVADQELIIK
tara:strand:- start:432 stop:548 length:117 start_codon:yes stop_codon:yes gene_type:complete